jgi:hypothetical protein
MLTIKSISQFSDIFFYGIIFLVLGIKFSNPWIPCIRLLKLLVFIPFDDEGIFIL